MLNSYILKAVIHTLRFNTDAKFEFDPGSRLYSLKTSDVVFTMPYVLTLRLKRHLKGLQSPTSEQLNDWYESLPVEEKSLIKRYVL